MLLQTLQKIFQKAKEVGHARWVFSLNGPTTKIHDHFRGVDGSFELKIPIQINNVVSNYNVNMLEDMVSIVKNYTVECIFLNSNGVWQKNRYDFPSSAYSNGNIYSIKRFHLIFKQLLHSTIGLLYSTKNKRK